MAAPHFVYVLESLTYILERLTLPHPHYGNLTSDVSARLPATTELPNLFTSRYVKPNGRGA